MLTPRGAEIWRIEGYLPKDLFRAELEMGAAKAEFAQKHFGEAERRFDQLAHNHPSHLPEALYWRNVSRYSASHDPTPLQEVERELRERFPDSVWTKKASVWRAS